MDARVKPKPDKEISISSHLKENLLPIGNWLFFIGSAIFTVDAFTEIADGFSLRAIAHIGASLLFAIGCGIFVYDERQKKLKG
jgi:hypothetical protein